MVVRVVGCDPSTKRCALADNTGRVDSILLHPTEDNGKRLAWSFRQIEIFARQFCYVDPPEMVLVERPSGKSRAPALVEMCGVTRAAIYTALEEMFGIPVPVFLVAPTQWKKAVLGAGNASKADYVKWVADSGISAANDDEAAAYCIAMAGEELT